MSQAETNLQYIQRALKKQKQMREKEIQLCNQLEVVCQRQCEAHRRNQDLLRDFRRIEQEMARLAEKTDNFKINQVDSMNQMQTILPMHYKCCSPSSCILGHVQQTCHTDIDSLPANCGYFGKPCHFTHSLDHFNQAARNHRLWSNLLISLQGCCNHPACCYCMYTHSYGRFVPYKCKIYDSKHGNESQKNRHSTNDLLVPISNKKDARTQQCPQFTHPKNNPYRDRIIHQQDALQHTWNKDMYEDSSKSFPIGAQEMVVENKVKTAVERSLEDNLRDISALHQEVPSHIITEEHKYSESSESICKLQHLPSALICLKHYDDDDNIRENANKGARKLSTQQLSERSLRGQSSEQNTLFKSVMETNSANCCSEGTETEFSLESKNVNDCKEKGLEIEKIEESKEKEACKSSKDGQGAETSYKSCEEMRIKHTSKTKHIGEEVLSQPIMKHLSDQILLNECYRDQDSEFSELVSESLHEEISYSEEISDSKDIKYLKGKAKKHKAIEAEMLSGQKSFENYGSQNERSVQSDLSKDKSSIESNSRWSISDTCLEMKEHKNVSRKGKCVSSTFSKGNFITKNQEKEEEGVIRERNKSQNEELKEDNDIMDMLQGKLVKTEISKTIESKKYAMYREDTDINSSTEEEEDEEGIGENYTGDEMASIVAVKEGEFKGTQKSKVNESDIEDTDDDDNHDDDNHDDDNHDDDDIVDDDNHDDDEIKDANENDDDEHDGEDYDDDDDDDVRTISGEDEKKDNGIQQKDLHKEICSIDAYENEIISEGEGESKCASSEGEQSFCEDQEELEDINNEKIKKNLSQENMNKDGDLQTPKRKEESAHTGEKVSYQELKGDEQTCTENQRSLWLCCLKSCSLSQSLNESRETKKRCSEDASMDLLQLNPIESRSALPHQELPASPTFSRNTEVASVFKTSLEDSSEESSPNEKKSKSSNQGWSDSEDDAHSFYD